jgi:hypothetical protein
MNDELFQNESLLDILDDIASFERERDEEDDQENTESDHFSFDK